MFFETLGYIAGLCTSLAFAPQLIKMIKTKAVNDLSLCSYCIFIFGMFLWLLYGISIQSIQVIIFNALGISTTLPVLYLIIKYKK